MSFSFQCLVLAVFFISLSSCQRLSDHVVATVDGERITATELREEMSMERGKFDPALLTQEGNFAAFRGQALDKIVQEKILLAEAKRQKVHPTEEEFRQIETTRSGALTSRAGDAAILDHGVNPKAWEEAQRRRLVIGNLIDREVISKIPVSEEKVAASYRQHLQEFSRPTQYRARQIIVDSKEQAEGILAKIKQGEDMGGLARAHSLSPDAKDGGDLGFFDSRSAPTIFTEICQQLKAGEVSDVVQTDYGFQIFQLLEKRPARQIPFEEAASSIRQRLQEEGSEAAFEQWFASLQQKAKVVVNEEMVKGVTLDQTH